MKKYFIIAALALLALGCTKESVTPQITLKSASEAQIATEGAIETVTFNSTVAWTASIDNADWKLSTKAGEAGDASIKVTAPQNEKDDAVVATLTIKAETVTATVKFTQLQKDCFQLVEEGTEISGEAQTIEVKVLSNTSYTVKSDVDWITAASTKGSVESTETFSVSTNKSGAKREGTITFTASGKEYTYTVAQEAWEAIFEADCESVSIEKEGGSATITLSANVEYKACILYESEWINVAMENNVFTVTAEANPYYASRTDYLYFETDEIMVPVLDDNGDPTGEEEFYSFYVPINQAGHATEAWAYEYTESIALPSTHTIAVFGDNVYVANKLSASLFTFSKADGTVKNGVDLSGICSDAINSISSDDAGNLVIAFGGDYCCNLTIYAVPAGHDITSANAVKLVEFYNEIYGYGLDNIHVTGDVTGEAAITMVSAYGDPTEAGSYAASWQITGGACEGSETCALLPTDGGVWYSGCLCSIQTSSKVNEGILYIGYGGHYDLCYNATMSDDGWEHIWVSGSEWAENYSGIDIVEWNGHKYAVVLGTAFFCYWGMPSYLNIINIDDPTNAEELVKTMHYNNGGVYFSEKYVNETTGDVYAEVASDGSLNVYVVDSGIGRVFKENYPVLN